MGLLWLGRWGDKMRSHLTATLPLIRYRACQLNPTAVALAWMETRNKAHPLFGLPKRFRQVLNQPGSKSPFFLMQNKIL